MHYCFKTYLTGTILTRLLQCAIVLEEIPGILCNQTEGSVYRYTSNELPSTNHLSVENHTSVISTPQEDFEPEIAYYIFYGGNTYDDYDSSLPNINDLSISSDVELSPAHETTSISSAHVFEGKTSNVAELAEDHSNQISSSTIFDHTIQDMVTMDDRQTDMEQIKESGKCVVNVPYFKFLPSGRKLVQPRCNAGQIIYMTACGILCLLVTSGNFTIIAVFLKASDGIMRNSQSIYKVSIAISDLITGLFVLPSVIISWTWGWESRAYTNVLGFVSSLTTLVSIFTLAISGFDRLAAVLIPMKYGKVRVKQFALAAVAAIWFISAAVSSLPLYISQVSFSYLRTGTLILVTGNIGTEACLLVSLSLVWINSVTIFAVIKLRSRKTARLTNSEARSNREKKLAITLCIMVIAFTINVMPHLIFSIVRKPHTGSFQSSEFNKVLSIEVTLVYLFFTNSLWNCVVYSFRNSEFRREAKRIFSSC